MKRSLRSWLWRVPVDEEVDEELAFHIEMRTRELVARGVEPKAAREMALARVGDLGRLKRTCVDLGRKRDREMWLTQWIEELRDDVTFALRQLKGAAGFAVVAVITLALGIGVNSAIFALVDATLLRPLPLPEPERLVMLWDRSEAVPRGRVSPGDFLDWTARNSTFERIAGFVPNVGGMVLAGADGVAETVSRQWVTGGIFDVLGVTPVAGRTFRPADEMQQSGAVVLSEGFWRTRFAGDHDVVGRQLRLDGAPYTVVGVVPDDARYVGSASIWALVPLQPNPAGRGPRVVHVIGRMRTGVTLDAARADMTALADTLAREFPESNRGHGVTIDPLHDAFVGSELRLTSFVFVGVVGFVLLICCANVANLLLARATVRARELSIRSALGAGRRRIIRQLLTESLVLATLGGLIGALVGAAILAAAPSVIPQGLLPGTMTLGFDARVTAFCVVAAILVAALFGVAPAWHVTAASPARGVASDLRTATTSGRGLRTLLVVGEVATAALLLFGAGLMLRTLLAVNGVERGYRNDEALTMVVDPIDGRYENRASLLRFFDAIEQEVRGIPGVRSVAWASTLPLGRSYVGFSSFAIAGDEVLDERNRPSADFQVVSPSYFGTLDLPIAAGRGFTERDTEHSPLVCIVNEAFVRRHLQGRSPLGVRLAIQSSWDAPGAPQRVREIVGVARQVRGQVDEREDFVQVYVPMAQEAIGDTFLLVQPSTGEAEALAPSVRTAIARIDKEQLVSVRDVRTLDDIAWEATSRYRFRAVMVLTFAGLALLLAMVGVFGVLAYSVQQRRRELGVRMALGATPATVVRLVLGDAGRLVAAGLALGLGLSFVLARSMEAFLFGVPPRDPVTFGSVGVVLLITATVACMVPVLRAARVEPAIAFRAE